MEAQFDGGSSSHKFIKESYLYTITYTTGKITQVTGDIKKYTGIEIILGKIGNVIILMLPSYLMKYY